MSGKSEPSLYMEPAIAPINSVDISEVSKKLGLEISDVELQEYADSVNKILASASTVMKTPPPKPKVSFPRTPGYRPTREENPYNAWFIKTEIKGSPSGVLAGKRVVIKDCIAVAGVPMMNGSFLLEGHVPDYDATVVTRILEAGGTLVGTSTCENLCASASSFNSALGPVCNPLDLKRSAGGSSSGSAVLVTTGQADMSVVTDLGGSARVPASFCGVVGLKPTHGLVPFTGATSIYAPMDHLGQIARTVEDTAKLLQAIAGPDILDARQNPGQPTPKNFVKEMAKGVAGLTVGILEEGLSPCTEKIQTVVVEAVEKLQTEGCTVKRVSVPWHKMVGDVFPHIATPGCYDSFEKGGIVVGNGGWHDVGLAQRMQMALNSQRRDLPRSMKFTCVLGEILKQKDNHKIFAKAENLVPMIRQAYEAVLNDCDVIVLPTTPCTAPLLPTSMAQMSLEEYMDAALGMTTNTSPFNITGHPALTVPVGSDECCLPIGAMVIGKHFQEDVVFRVGKALEKD